MIRQAKDSPDKCDQAPEFMLVYNWSNFSGSVWLAAEIEKFLIPCSVPQALGACRSCHTTICSQSAVALMSGVVLVVARLYGTYCEPGF